MLARLPSVSRKETYSPTPGMSIGWWERAAGGGDFLDGVADVVHRDRDRRRLGQLSGVPASATVGRSSAQIVKR